VFYREETGWNCTFISDLESQSAYLVLPIAKKHDKLLPVVELQRAYFAMTPASFVLLPLLIGFNASAARDLLRLLRKNSFVATA
jgi:hypothetical protein